MWGRGANEARINRLGRAEAYTAAASGEAGCRSRRGQTPRTNPRLWPYPNDAPQSGLLSAGLTAPSSQPKSTESEHKSTTALALCAGD